MHLGTDNHVVEAEAVVDVGTNPIGGRLMAGNSVAS